MSEPIGIIGIERTSFSDKPFVWIHRHMNVATQAANPPERYCKTSKMPAIESACTDWRQLRSDQRLDF